MSHTPQIPLLPAAAEQDRIFLKLWRRLRRWQHYPYFLYETAAWLFRHQKQWRMMNYGWEPELGAPLLNEALKDHPERYALQLYHHIGSAISLVGKDVLEVGSGRGGGSIYLHTTFQPKHYLALDFSTQAVKFCNRLATPAGLQFAVGNAMDLPCADTSQDAVVNVESSHNYADRLAFYHETFRVLRPGSDFLYSDVLPEKQYAKMKKQLKIAGFELVTEHRLNEGVLRALQADDERKEAWIFQHVPRLLQKLARLFAATKESHSHDKLASGYSHYFLIHARKPEALFT